MAIHNIYVVEKRLKTIEHQPQRTCRELQEYSTQLQENVQQWQPQVNPDVLFTAVTACVKRGQQRLKQEFDYRKKMLELNVSDRHWITKFYNLQPSEEQVREKEMPADSMNSLLRTFPF